MQYKINNPDKADGRALMKLCTIVECFERSAMGIFESHNVEFPWEVRYSWDNPDYMVSMQYSGYQLMHDAPLDALVDIRSFDFRLGHLFKAAAESGISDKLVHAMPKALASLNNKGLFEKYEMLNLATVAKMR